MSCEAASSCRHLNTVTPESIGDELIGKLGLATVKRMQQGGLTQQQLEGLHARIAECAAKGEVLFGKSCDHSQTAPTRFIREQLSALLESVVRTVESQPPDCIREARLSEAVFSHKDDNRTILATDSLATCIGVAGYDRKNGFGFVIHFTHQKELDASGALLLERIQAYRTDHPDAPLFIHLRGGIKGASEPLLGKVKEWLEAKDLNATIASEETLQEPIAHNVYLPKVGGSIKLDVRTGTCETYDYRSNFYSKRKNSEGKPFLDDLLVEAATQTHQITIVYDPRNGS